ncbi:MAG: HAD family hydrolase [Gaiellaceae bacterium]
MIRAVFFDVGETLVNEGRWWAELGRAVGVEPHVVWAAVGTVVDRGERHSRVWDLLGVEPPGSETVGWEGADLYEDAVPCLERLRAAGYFVGLAGNIGREIEPFVDRFELEVDYATASHTLGVEKPALAFFERLLEVADRPSEQVAYVGDRIDNDIIPALETGIFAVHIRRGPWGFLQDGADRAQARIASLDELPWAFERG